MIVVVASYFRTGASQRAHGLKVFFDPDGKRRHYEGTTDPRGKGKGHWILNRVAACWASALLNSMGVSLVPNSFTKVRIPRKSLLFCLSAIIDRFFDSLFDPKPVSPPFASRGLRAVAPADTAVWAQTTTGFAGVHGANAAASGRGVYFDWDEEHGNAHDVGMIAEEVGGVLPEVVQFEENGIDASGMDYSKMTPLLVEAIKALRAEKVSEITSLRAETTSLHEEITSLLAENRDLRAENEEFQRRFTRLESLVLQLQSQNN